METGLRIVLLLVAVLIVAGIIWDTIRSRRKPMHNKRKPYRIDRLETPVNQTSKKPKKSKEKTLEPIEPLEAIEPDLTLDEWVIPKTNKNQSVLDDSDFSANDLELDRVIGAEEKSQRFSDIITVADGSKVKSNSVNDRSKSKKETKYTEEKNAEETVAPDKLFALNVMARKPGVFLGKKLISAFDEVHLFFGDMQIFHRYENTDGSGKLMFSLALAVEPGYFDIDNLENFRTVGLTLFFSPTTRNHSIAAFELMLRTAKILASTLDGEIKDQKRRPLTLEIIESYREEVRESVKLRRASSKRESTRVK